MKRIFLLINLVLIVLFLFPQQAEAQRWKRFKMEVGLNLGVTNFLGDLGGNSEGDGTRFGDFQFAHTRPAFGGWFKYRFHNRFAIKGNLLYGRLYATDENDKNEIRQRRNLDFRSPVIELSGQVEFYFLKEKIGAAYRIKGVKGYGSSNFSGYLFAGVGLIYFDPHGTDQNGTWVKLAPLNTEGQGLPGGPKDYSRVTVTFPMGFGFKYNFSREWGIAFEYGLRMTPSDYLDDASTTYYDPNAIEAAYGPLAKEMSDKRLHPSRFNGEGNRGNNARKDAYMFGFLTLTYRIKSGARSRTRF